MTTITKVAQTLLEQRYFLEGENWEGLCRRVSRFAAGDDGEKERKFFDVIYNQKFLPSRMPYQGTERPAASSCFVIGPIEDNLESIMDNLKDACLCQKSGGGSGYDFSLLRPEGDLISTTGGLASGPISFMELYDKAMQVVVRAGKKQGAQMGVLRCDHPSIIDFIHCKDDDNALPTFNISVAILDSFVRQVLEDGDWDLVFGGKVYQTIRAKELWDMIAKHAWENGDPGLIFIDTVNRYNRFPEKITASNPCGETNLPPFGSCNLGSINLAYFAEGGSINHQKLVETVQTAIEYLNGVLDHAWWPLEKIKEKTLKYRNLGLGVMGWHDMLIQLGIPYDSEEALGLAFSLMRTINDTAIAKSEEMGDGERLNITVTSVAPTGSISLLANCSSGIEPIFGVVTVKNTNLGAFYKINPYFEKIAKSRGFWSGDLIEEIAKQGSVKGLVPKDVEELFKTATEINWKDHVQMQAAFQKNTELAISKTICMPNDATVGDVKAAFQLAWELNCKSTTVYRDGSRSIQVLENKLDKHVCPECGQTLRPSEGCWKCPDCWYSLCSIL